MIYQYTLNVILKSFAEGIISYLSSLNA